MNKYQYLLLVKFLHYITQHTQRRQKQQHDDKTETPEKNWSTERDGDSGLVHKENKSVVKNNGKTSEKTERKNDEVL